MKRIGAVSPDTRPRERISPVMMRGIPIGSTTFQIVWSLVAPRARLPSRIPAGMSFRASSVVRIISGRESSPRVREPARMLSPNPRYLTNRAMPKSPKTIEGTPLRLLVIRRMKRTTHPLEAYSFM